MTTNQSRPRKALRLARPARALLLPLVGAAAAALVFASLGQANHLGSLLLGHANIADESTSLSGNTSGGPELDVTNTSSSPALKASSTSGKGVFGRHTSSTGTSPGVHGETSSTQTDAAGVVGQVNPAVPGAGSAGVLGTSAGTPKSGFTAGVHGDAESGMGVYGTTETGTAGVYGLNNGTGTLVNGVWGHAQSGRGVRGTSPFGTGVSGESGSAVGVYGQTTSDTKPAVSGVTLAGKATAEGVHGEAQGGGTGVVGKSPVGSGVIGTTNAPRGIYTSLPAGVKGFAEGGGGAGVNGRAKFEAIGVFGYSAGGPGVLGKSGTGLAGQFLGDVSVTGTLTKGAGSFRIDHPLDPAHKYLQHSFVESPEMKNVYDGIATTDGRGFATVRLPRWFQALNRDFRYQLTGIGSRAWGAPMVVWRELHANRFTIRSRPHVRVSWQLTGIRHDPYANAHRIQVEERKPAAEQGTYLHPELYGKKGER
jgi:hypothetical protein